jgi:hypothetical protein
MEALIVGLVLSFCSALAYVAYTHPGPFSRIANVLNYSTQAILIALGLWHTSASFERTSIHTAVYQSELLSSESKGVVGGIISQVGDKGLPMLYVFVIYLVWFAFLTVLKFLPSILSLEDKMQDQDKR